MKFNAFPLALGIILSISSPAAIFANGVDVSGVIFSSPTTNYKTEQTKTQAEKVNPGEISGVIFLIEKEQKQIIKNEITAETFDDLTNKILEKAKKDSPLIAYSAEFLGKPYKYGGNGPDSFDCSGYIKYVYKKFGIELERTTYGMINQGEKITKDELKTGDLIFFDTINPVGMVKKTEDENGAVKEEKVIPSEPTHVGIYISDGKFIHGSTSKGKISIDDLNTGYYSQRLLSINRVADL